MTNLVQYRFQLEQLEERIQKNPNNENLQKIRVKLQNLIKLTEEAEAKRSLSTQTALQKKSQKSLLPGDCCEALDPSSFKWYEATIQSVEEARFTVIFAGTCEAQHCSINEIRPLRPDSAKRKPVENNVQQNKSLLNPKKVKDANSVPKIGASKRNKPSKAEYIQKKEDEHRAKQESWQKFTQKFGTNKRD